MLERLPRWLAWPLSFLGGIIIATVATGINQASVTVAGASLPWGLVVGLLLVTAYFVALRLLAPTRWPVIFAAVGVVATVSLFSLHGPGGSLLIVGNLQGFIWAYAPIILAAIVIIWPKLPEKDATPN